MNVDQQESAKLAGPNAGEIGEDVTGYKRRKKRRTAVRENGRVQLVETSGVVDELTGVHWHFLEADRLTTEIDGQHMHLVELPDGTLIPTEPGGEHAHEEGGKTTGHAHDVVMPDGTVITLDPEEDHVHVDWLVERTTVDGVHKHTGTLPDGTVIVTLDTEGLLAMKPSEEPDPAFVPVDDLTPEQETLAEVCRMLPFTDGLE